MPAESRVAVHRSGFGISNRRVRKSLFVPVMLTFFGLTSHDVDIVCLCIRSCILDYPLTVFDPACSKLPILLYAETELDKHDKQARLTS